MRRIPNSQVTAFTLPAIDGTRFTLDDIKGKRYLLAVFRFAQQSR